MDALHWFFVVLMVAMVVASSYYIHLLRLKNTGMEMEAEGLRGKLKEAKSDVQFIQDQRDTYLSQVRGFAKIEAENKQLRETVETLESDHIKLAKECNSWREQARGYVATCKENEELDETLSRVKADRDRYRAKLITIYEAMAVKFTDEGA